MFVNLVNSGEWTQAEVDTYINRLKERGITYSVGGDYFALFARADAIINDSGSFTVEWLFTGKPGCFIKNPLLSEKHLTSLMNKALSEYTIAESEDEIVQFVKMIDESSVNLGELHMKDWVRDNVAINYPHVSDALLSDLESVLI